MATCPGSSASPAYILFISQIWLWRLAGGQEMQMAARRLRHSQLSCFCSARWRAVLPEGCLTVHAAMQVGMVQGMQSATRQLCHSQLSWFRSEPAFRWVDATPAPQDVAAVIAAEVAGSSPLAGTLPHVRELCDALAGIWCLWAAKSVASVTSLWVCRPAVMPC